MGITYLLQRELLKKEMNHVEVFEDTWMDKKHKWLDYVRNDALCSAFCHARYSKGMEIFLRFRIKIV